MSCVTNKKRSWLMEMVKERKDRRYKLVERLIKRMCFIQSIKSRLNTSGWKIEVLEG